MKTLDSFKMENISEEDMVQQLKDFDEIHIVAKWKQKDDEYYKIEIHEGSYYLGGEEGEYSTDYGVSASTAQGIISHILYEVKGIENIISYSAEESDIDELTDQLDEEGF